ncbi:actin cross-linking [Kockiozyma suomiensis]|uniref:actin cross-linking n=1 Tax=Kockiozyma suomiensis TaxID=1337062 RepID=UPI0033439618
MVSKLTFKSDKSTKKRKRHVDADSKQDGQQDQDRRQDQESQDQPNEWVDAEMTCDLNGPCMFLVNQNSTLLGISCDSAGKLFASASSSTPSSVQQVLVLSPILQSSFFTLKSYLGKFISVSKYGVCEATSEAIGPEQQFQLELLDNGLWSIKSVAHNMYLSLDQKDVRCDSSQASLNESFTIRVQSKYLKRPKKEIKSESLKIHTKELEERVGSKLDYDSIKLLKAAYKDGKLNEEIIRIREKIKGDHRC